MIKYPKFFQGGIKHPMKIKPFSFVVFSLLIIFAVVSFGGCGGSSSSFNGGNGNNGGGGGTSSAGLILIILILTETEYLMSWTLGTLKRSITAKMT